MRKSTSRSVLLGLLLLSSCVSEPGFEPSATEKITQDGSWIIRSDTGRLTAPSSEDFSELAADFLLSRSANLADLIVASQSELGGVTHVRLTQAVDGLRVHGAYAKIAI